jgi:phage tail sheath protein FI
MPANLTAPGVYIEEEPSGARTIVGVSTSVTAFIGRTWRGPTDEAVRIDNFGDYERIFGGLWSHGDLAHGVRQFFSNGGRTAIIVRVVDTATESQGTGALALVLEPTPQVAALPGFDHLRLQVSHGGAADAFTLTISAEDAGDTTLQDTSGPVDYALSVDLTLGGNPVTAIEAAMTTTTPAIPLARVTSGTVASRPDETSPPHIEGAAVTWPSVDGMQILPSAEAAALPGFDHLRVQVIHGVAADAFSLTISAEDAGNTTLQDTSGPPVDYTLSVDLTLGGDPVADLAAATTTTTPAIPLARLVAAPATRPAETADSHAVVGFSGGEASAPMPGFIFRAADPGSWGDGIEVTVTPDPGGLAFSLTARLVDISGREQNRETFNNLNLGTGAVNSATDVLAARSSLVRMTQEPAALPSGEIVVTLSSGSDGNEPPIAAYEGSPSSRLGFYALDDVDVVNLVCAPFPAATDVVSESDRASFWSATVLPWCQKRGAMAIIDPPPSWSSFDAVNADLADSAGWISSLRSPYGAQYFPNLVAADPLQENRLRPFAPCGAAAGVIARTDASRGVWKAAAGIDATLAGMLDVSIQLTDGEQGMLNREGINCARAWPSTGRVLWGARTLFGDDRRASEWKYMPVRRLASYLQQSLLRGTRWAVFEGNDETLWSQLRLNIEGFMHQLFRQGAFAGTDPQDAYFVKCDSDTTTQADIDAGIVNVRVGFAPVQPAEFVILRIRQIAGQ